MEADLSVESCSVSVERIPDAVVVNISGEVDIATISLLASALQDAGEMGMDRIVLDARDLVYIDSAGIQTLVSFQKMLTGEGRNLSIVGCHGIFRKLIAIAHLDDHLPMHTTLEEALS